MNISEVSFIDDIYILNEVYGYKTEVDYEEVFRKLSEETKKDLFEQTNLYYNIIFEQIDTDNHISHNIECIHKISDIEVVGDIIFQRFSVSSCNNKKINKVSFKLFVNNAHSNTVILQYVSVSTPVEMMFINFDINMDMFNCIFNCLFHIYIIVKNYKYDSLFSYIYHEADFNNIKNIKEREIRLFGNKENMECSVCLNATTIKSICNHYLCRRCFSKIENNNCPLCRKDIEFFNDDEMFDENLI